MINSKKTKRKISSFESFETITAIARKPISIGKIYLPFAIKRNNNFFSFTVIPVSDSD